MNHGKHMITIPADVIKQYELFTLVNSPYTAHDEGRAIDLYPPEGTAPSPVSGEVIDIKTVQAPSQPYAVEQDHLIIIDTDVGQRTYYTAGGEPAVARVMHVEPTVSVGDIVEGGESLGNLVRAGFFAPWVKNHLHVGFRAPEPNYTRASGSLPLSADIDVEPLRWDGTGTIKEAGKTYAMLDLPEHPSPGDTFVGIADDSGKVAIDGGLPHFDRGGVFGDYTGNLKLLETTIGEVQDGMVEWSPVQVYANTTPIMGLSLFAARTNDFGARLVCPEHSFSVGTEVSVEIQAAGEE